MKADVTIAYHLFLEGIEIPDGLDKNEVQDRVIEKVEDLVAGLLYGDRSDFFDSLSWLGTTVEVEGEEILEISGR